MITKLERQDGSLAIDKEDAIALLKHIEAGGDIPELSFDADDIRGLIAEERTAEVEISFSFEATLSSIDEEDDTEIGKLINHQGMRRALEEAIFKVISRQAENHNIDISALNLNSNYTIDGNEHEAD